MEEGRVGSKELEGLLVEEDEQAIDVLLREVLGRFVGFTREGRFVMKPDFLKLSHQNRLLVALLARHAAVRLNLPRAAVEATPETLQQECMVPLKSCREYLSKLKRNRFLEKNSKGYFVPDWALSTAAKSLRQQRSTSL